MKPLENRTILIVEDDSDRAKLIKDLFESHGANVILAEDGSYVLELIEKNKIDIIVSDLNMPHVNGFEMTRRIRESNKDVPILVYTSSKYTPQGMEDLARELGINKFISGSNFKLALSEVLSRFDSALFENQAIASKIADL